MTTLSKPNDERKLRELIDKVNRFRDQDLQVSNLVLTTVEDIIEIMHVIVPYTMSKLDETYEARKHLYAASEVRQAIYQALKNKTDSKMIKAIIEDVSDDLAALRGEQSKGSESQTFKSDSEPINKWPPKGSFEAGSQALHGVREKKS